MKQQYTIGQLAKLAGISIKTLRVYEKKGLLMPERNEENSYRMYGSDAVKTLEKIQLMKYLDFSLDQIGDFLQLYENVSRENMLLQQKRLLEKKREQLNTVIAHVDRAVNECKNEDQDEDDFLRALGIIIRNQRADELVGRLNMHADEPRGWSRFVFEKSLMKKGMNILDAGAGYGNIWRYNLERLPKHLMVSCVDKHNTHMDTFCDFIKEKEIEGRLLDKDFSFIWKDLETMNFDDKYDIIFFNHVAFQVSDRMAMYRKFSNALSDDGTFICTWGGLLFYEKLQPILLDFFNNRKEICAELDKQYKRHISQMSDLESELKETFKKVERLEYVVTLSFATAEDFMEYILQVCRPAREELELRRPEFIKYLNQFENEMGYYTFDRDTYMYRCCNQATDKKGNGV